MIRQCRNLQKAVNCDQQENEHRREGSHPLLDGHSACINGKEGQQELAEDIDKGTGDDLIKRILKKCLEPAPEKPVHLWNDEKWNENRPDQQEYSLSYQTEANDHQHDRLN